MAKRLLIIDHFDSFTYNLAGSFRAVKNWQIIISRPHELDIETVGKYDKIVFSPGPGIPDDFPLMSQILNFYEKRKSILGICLGHQAIGVHYGLYLYNLSRVRHGLKAKVSIIQPSEYIFYEIPSFFEAGLYHSWALQNNENSDVITSTAIDNYSVIMAIAHVKYDVTGLQFHPESYMSAIGNKILLNWLHH